MAESNIRPVISNEEYAMVRDAVARGDREWLVAYLCGVSAEELRKVMPDLNKDSDE